VHPDAAGRQRPGPGPDRWLPPRCGTRLRRYEHAAAWTGMLP